MTKRVGASSKKRVSKAKKKTSTSKVVRGESIERALFDNFISLQNVLADLVVKLDGLTTKVSDMFDLFESSAKSLAEKDFSAEKEGKDNEKIIEKLENLSEQNKIIAKGLTLIHDKSPKEQETTPERSFEEPREPAGMGYGRVAPQGPPLGQQGYQRSISANSKPIASGHNA